VGQHRGAAVVREVLAEDRLLDHDTVGHVQEVATGKERGVQRREAVVVRVSGREEQRRDQLLVALRGDRQRFLLAEHGVGERDGQIADRGRVDHVTEIQKAHHDPVGDDDIVVIRIAVNHAVAQTRPVNLLPLREQAFDTGPPVVRQQPCVFPRHSGAPQIPLQDATHRRVRKIAQRGVDPGDAGADRFKQAGAA